MANQRILFVDDDEKILNGICRKFEDDFDIEIAVGSAEGLRMVRQEGPFALVISDMRMPGMNGIELLIAVENLAPDTVRMMLTGFSDFDATVDAINRGHIFRFLAKPCSDKLLRQAMELGIRQHELLRSEKELLESTLTASLRLLFDMFSLANPELMGSAARVRRIAVSIAEQMQVEHAWEIDVAAMLGVLGKITLTPGTLHKVACDAELTVEERDAFERHPEIGRALLEKIPRLGNVSEIVLAQECDCGFSGLNKSKATKPVPVGARILKVAADFDRIAAKTGSEKTALAELEMQSERYEAMVLASLETLVDQWSTRQICEPGLRKLKPGMVLANDILDIDGNVRMEKGQEVTEVARRFIKTLHKRNELAKPVQVFVSNPAEAVLV